MTLARLAWHFFLLSFVAFGAATSILPELHRVLVDSTHALSDGEFSGLFAMSQAAPGTNVMFVTVLGWQVASLPGAFTTTASFLVPTGLIALAVERYGTRHHQARWHVALRQALVPITIGFLLSTGYLLGAGTLTPCGIGLMLATIGVLMGTRWSPLWLTALGAVLGAAGLV
jgi:chromate transporter